MGPEGRTVRGEKSGRKEKERGGRGKRKEKEMGGRKGGSGGCVLWLAAAIRGAGRGFCKIPNILWSVFYYGVGGTGGGEGRRGATPPSPSSPLSLAYPLLAFHASKRTTG